MQDHSARAVRLLNKDKSYKEKEMSDFEIVKTEGTTKVRPRWNYNI